jgi:hypothetical protein
MSRDDPEGEGDRQQRRQASEQQQHEQREARGSSPILAEVQMLIERGRRVSARSRELLTRLTNLFRDRDQK